MKVVSTALVLVAWLLAVAALELALVPHRLVHRALGDSQ